MCVAGRENVVVDCYVLLEHFDVLFEVPIQPSHSGSKVNNLGGFQLFKQLIGLLDIPRGEVQIIHQHNTDNFRFIRMYLKSASFVPTKNQSAPVLVSATICWIAEPISPVPPVTRTR